MEGALENLGEIDAGVEPLRKAYVIIRGNGAWSERWSTPVKVFLDRDVAQTTMEKLEAVQRRFGRNAKDCGPRNPPEVRRAAAAAYRDLGFDADDEDDWELVETDLAI
jgi:hypothetical protein